MSTVKAINFQHPSATAVNLALAADGTVAGNAPWGGRNRIINGGCSVWQRGTTGLPTGDAYRMDMLRINGGTTTRSTDVPSGVGVPFSASTASMSTPVVVIPVELPATGVAGDYTGNWVLSFYAKFDSGKTMYLGIWFADASAGGNQSTIVDYVPPAGTSFVGTGSWQRYSFPINITSSPNATNTCIRITLLNLTGGFSLTSFAITGMQFEKGTVPTAFEVKPYVQELRDCQRYYWRNTAGSTYGPFLSGWGTGTGSVRFWALPPVPMRTIPTALDNANLSVTDWVSANIVPSSVSIVASESTAMVASIDVVASGITSYRPYALRANNNTAAYFGLSAEL